MLMSECYKYDNEELVRLSEQELPDPPGLVEKINQLCLYNIARNTKLKYEDYISTLELWEGKFLERTFAFTKLKKSGKLQYKEVVRTLEGNSHKLVKDIYLPGMGGYKTLWKPKLYGGWYHSILNLDKNFRIENKDYYNLYDHDYYFDILPNNDFSQMDSNQRKLENLKFAISLDPSIKFCGYEYYFKKWGNWWNFIFYISVYRVYPEIEMYSKFGIAHLITDTRFRNRCKKDKNFLKYVVKNVKSISEKRTNYNNILGGYKYGSYEGYELEKEIQKYKKSDLDELIVINLESIKKYLIKQKSNFRYYLDYFNAAKQFNIDMNQSKLLMPRDLNYWHDHYINEVKAKADREIEEQFKEVSKEWSKINYEDDKFMIFVAPSQEEIIKEGMNLNHCVGKMGYSKKMAEGGNLILFLREIEKPDVSFYTVEYNKEENKVIQCRSRNNSQKERWDEVSEFINAWQRIVPRLKQKAKKKEEKRKKASKKLALEIA